MADLISSKVIFNLLRAQSFPCQQGVLYGLLVWRRQTILFPVPYAGFFYVWVKLYNLIPSAERSVP